MENSIVTVIESEINKVKNLIVNHIVDEVSKLSESELEVLNDYELELSKNKTVIKFSKTGVEVFNNKKNKEVLINEYKDLSITEMKTIMDYLVYSNDFLKEDIA